jgi:hypothetical protein
MECFWSGLGDAFPRFHKRFLHYRVVVVVVAFMQ